MSWPRQDSSQVEGVVTGRQSHSSANTSQYSMSAHGRGDGIVRNRCPLSAELHRRGKKMVVDA